MYKSALLITVILFAILVAPVMAQDSNPNFGADNDVTCYAGAITMETTEWESHTLFAISFESARALIDGTYAGDIQQELFPSSGSPQPIGEVQPGGNLIVLSPDIDFGTSLIFANGTFGVVLGIESNRFIRADECTDLDVETWLPMQTTNADVVIFSSTAANYLLVLDDGAFSVTGGFLDGFSESCNTYNLSESGVQYAPRGLANYAVCGYDPEFYGWGNLFGLLTDQPEQTPNGLTVEYHVSSDIQTDDDLQ